MNEASQGMVWAFLFVVTRLNRHDPGNVMREAERTEAVPGPGPAGEWRVSRYLDLFWSREFHPRRRTKYRARFSDGTVMTYKDGAYAYCPLMDGGRVGWTKGGRTE